MRSAISFAAFCAVMITPALAQEGKPERTVERTLLDKEPYQLVYDHVTAQFTLYDDDGSIVRGWSGVDAGRATGVAAPVPPNRPLEVVVVNANTLVYDFEITADIVGTRRVRACQDLGKEFVTQGILTTGRSIMGGAKLPDLGSVLHDLKEVSDNEELEFGFGGDERARALDEARAAVTRYNELTSYVSRLAGTLDDSIASIATLADAEPIDSLVDQLLRRIDSQYAGLSDPRMAPVILARANRDVQAVLNRVTQTSSSDPLGQEAVSLRRQLDAATAASADDVRAFQVAVLKLRRARAASRQSVMLPPSELGRRVVIELSPAPDSLVHDVFAIRAGEVVAHTRPAVGIMCQVSIGLNWMAPASEYDAVNGFVVDQTSTDDVRTTPAVFFSVGTPAFPLLGVIGGVGLGKGGRPDLYLGGTLRALAPVLLNFGAVWQRTMELPGALQPGDQLPDGFRDFDRSYQPSFFAGLSFSR